MEQSTNWSKLIDANDYRSSSGVCASLDRQHEDQSSDENLPKGSLKIFIRNTEKEKNNKNNKNSARWLSLILH